MKNSNYIFKKVLKYIKKDIFVLAFCQELTAKEIEKDRHLQVFIYFFLILVISVV